MDGRVGEIGWPGQPVVMSVVAVWISLMSTMFGVAQDPECYVLGGLDVARAEALADTNMTELRSVYASPAASSHDRRLLKRYAARGYRVVGAGMVREECRVVARATGRVELDVVDRLAPAWAVSEAGESTRLPRARSERHRVVLTGGHGRWQVASVR